MGHNGGKNRGIELVAQFMLAAGGSKDDGAVPLYCSSDCIVCSGVTSVKAKDDVGWYLGCEIGDAGFVKGEIGPAEVTGQVLAFGDESGVAVDADKLGGYVEDIVEVVICGKREVRTATATVDECELII